MQEEEIPVVAAPAAEPVVAPRPRATAWRRRPLPAAPSGPVRKTVTAPRLGGPVRPIAPASSAPPPWCAKPPPAAVAPPTASGPVNSPALRRPSPTLPRGA